MSWYNRENYRTEASEEMRHTIVHKVFPKLRKSGILARANFKCCQTCGYDAISRMIKSKHIGVTFWHNQDEDSFKGKDPYVFLSFSHSGNEEDHVKSERIGRIIRDTCVEFGIAVDWDGSFMHRIKLFPAN